MPPYIPSVPPIIPRPPLDGNGGGVAWREIIEGGGGGGGGGGVGGGGGGGGKVVGVEIAVMPGGGGVAVDDGGAGAGAPNIGQAVVGPGEQRDGSYSRFFYSSVTMKSSHHFQQTTLK